MTLKKIIIALSLLYTAQIAVAAPKTASQPPQWQKVALGTAGATYAFSIYSNHPFSADMHNIRQVIFVQHGIKRDGDNYYRAAEKLMRENDVDPRTTLLIAPEFFATADASKTDLGDVVAWNGDDWIGGYDSVKGPRPISSMQVMDDLMMRLMDRRRFPALKRIVVAGHSGGGQIVQRYAILNQIDEKVRSTGIDLSYVVANPSSYLYFTDERPSGNGFARYDTGICPTYNDYRYGMDKIIPYAMHEDKAALFPRYAARKVTYLLGDADINPNHRVLDKACAAEAQGRYRLERGHNYVRYEQYLAGNQVHLNRAAYEVIDIGHNQQGMFGSQCGAKTLFGLPAGQSVDGAPCKKFL